MVIGPGIGLNAGSAEFLREFIGRISADTPAVFDADALTILSQMPEWWTRVAGPVVLTPHPGEMARLCGVSVEEVQSARVGIAAEKANEWGTTVVLKGAYTVIATPDEPTVICPLAFPALASGGTGDALAGIITGFLAQGLSTFDAARAGFMCMGWRGCWLLRGTGI